MQNQSEQDSAFVSLVYMIHFYASVILGGIMFHRVIYPFAYFAKEVGTDLAAQLPIYFINVMAFGCLVYVATRPMALLSAAIVRAFERAIEKSKSG